MATGPNLRVRISADLADIKQGLGLLRNELATVRKQAAAAMPNLGSNAAVAGVRRLRQELVGLAGAYISLRGVSALKGFADEATMIRGRVRAAKGDYEALLALAQETRSRFEATVDLYARMERVTRNQNVSQERLMRITKAVNQAVKLSYVDAGTANAAITQFAQGLAAGVLRGQDLNSVIAFTPVLAEAIAKGLGRQVGEIKKLGEQGKLTTQEVLKALEKQAKALEEEFSAVPVTIADALTQIRNSFVDYVGDQDEATGASRRFAETLQDIAKDLPKYLDPLLTALRLVLENLEALAVFMVVRFAGAAIPAVIAGVASLVAWLKAAATGATTLRGALMLLGGPVGVAVAALATGVYVLSNRLSESEKVQREHNKAIEEFNRLSGTSKKAASEYAVEQRKLALATLAAARAQVEQLRATAVSGMGGVVGSAGAPATALHGLGEAQKKLKAAQAAADEWARKLVELSLAMNEEWDAANAPTPPIDEPAKAIARSNALMRDTVARALAELERRYKEHEVGISEYFAARQQLQQQAIDLQIEQARNELAITKDLGKRRDLEEQIAILMRDRADVAVRAAREQKEAEEDLTKALGAVKLRLLELDGETGRVERAKLEEEYRDLFKRLEAASDEAGQAMVRNLIERLVAKAQFDQLGDRLSQVTGRLASTEGSVSAQMQAGALGMGEGERQLNAAREAALAKLRQLRAETVAYLKTLAPDSKEAADALDFLDRIDTELANVTASQRRLAMAIEDQAVSAFGDFLGDLVEGTKSFKEAFTDMVRSFVAGVARMMAQELALRAIRSLIGGWGGGASAGVGHSGGVAGMLGTVRRNVSPLMFGAAPRYHSGGVAGLAPDEVPAILRRGEEVLTQSDPRHRFNGGMGGGGDRTVVKTPIVAIGDRAVADALASAAGEEVVLTHVRNNWDTLVNAR